MTIRNLDAIFRPGSVALIGASSRPHSVGAVIAGNLRESGFDGPILPVNPKHRSVAGILCYPDITSLPITPDLALICTPAESVPGLIAGLGARGTRAAIVITAGFHEGGNEAGAKLQAAMLAAARPHLLRVIGPNCLGVVSTAIGLNASFAPSTPLKGEVAFVAQSGAMVTTVLDWATARGIGFSHLVSLGDMSDVDFGDMLDFLANDQNTSAILLYIEAVTAARKFLSAARAASRVKPVIAIKAGRQAAAARAAASHTGALAGIDGVYDAAFERAGILRAYDLDEVFDATETLANRPHITGGKLAIVTNGGGVGVLATDALIAQGGELASLSPETLARLDKSLPHTWSHGNPIDIIGDADAARYGVALDAVAEAKEVDAVLVLNCPVAVASSTEAAKAVVRARTGKPILANWLGAQSASQSRQLFASADIPAYDTPEKAVRGFMHLVRNRRMQETLQEVPPATPSNFSPDAISAAKIVTAALERGEGWLDPQEVSTLLSCYDVPIVRTAIAASPRAAADATTALGAPVVLKILSRDIMHKSDVGGVALDVPDAQTAHTAAEAMIERVRKAAPKAHIDGFVVQQMIRRPNAYELILGMAVDKTFGPFLLFGQGGTAVEVINDKALALPPLNLRLAREVMARTRIWRQLKGYRDRPPVALDEIALTLVKLSQLVSDLDEIVELDINPLLADEHGVIALDARVRVSRPDNAAHARLAIPPYPNALEGYLDVSGTGRFHVRPVKPEDAEALVAFARRLSDEDMRMRFFSPLRALPSSLLARLTQIDYDREMAFVLFDSAKTVAAVGRLAADPDGERAEFALAVRTDLKGRGIGHALLEKLVIYARQRGIHEVWGNVLPENTTMLALCRELGFDISGTGHGLMLARLMLA
ncbi:MAG: bifunctional acetate--CoA ligase family protein/GNAT family N-acetyltransferase [Proteobacteria bacterium]|nr:bifunctional acetate--CoA ligase family protein/GNAT family N-acetyltransferase [Pseudomonadota bacterium]